ncbi:ATP-dependent helicase [Enterobacter sp.]|uniref:ATP-dependent helicase n=1 Tax=Enterobacter sp. TaxID=42895 RepID=UPI00296E86AC|nr:ATP-dependent helicase [Enterobacter sp.]
MHNDHPNDDPLNLFAAPTRDWFVAAFRAPTGAQCEAWRAIATGKPSLIVAPTGSGKTLAAFLHAIDALFKEKAHPPEKPDKKTATRILYISPIKALATDVERNLRIPLEGVSAERQRQGLTATPITVGVRSGDTPTAERAKLLRTPPDILITTPESLFLLLTSQGRETLRGINTIIIDEVHAMAGSKRGSQLALSLERLDALLAVPAQRVGLSATVHPVSRIAEFLGGSQPVTLVNPPSGRKLDLRVVVPVEDMTDIPGRPDAGDPSGRAGAGGSIWPHVEARILDEVLARQSTIIFTNTRGLAEKLTARLNELYALRQGEQPVVETAALHSFSGGVEKRTEGVGVYIARSHHGSVSKEQRKEIESALKAGELRCVVATSSLELGIDMGLVDLVIQVGAPPSVASALQRVGRASHQVGGTSSGVMFPRTRRDLVDATVIVRRMREKRLETLTPPRNPLDVLAQQTIAAVAMDTLRVDEWYDTVRRADPFRTLPRAAFDATLDMLAGKYPSDAFSQLRPRLIWDRENDLLMARPGAQHLAVTSGGTIPDRGMYTVILPEGEEQAGSRRVGELDEEMVFESRVNDIITLGATSWRIQQITHDQVVVVPAPGRSARLPFWRGEGVGRPAELGEAIGEFLRATGSHPEPALLNALQRDGLDASAAQNLLTLLREQQEATGILPTDRTLVVERCRDETGDWRVILHSPYGKRVHAPWAQAIADRIRLRMGLDPAIAASDDGIIARFPDTDGRVPGAELFIFDPDRLQRAVAEGVGNSALFAARFRECASRALLLPRRSPGKRSPLWQQRLRASQLLAVAREYADFPVLLETARECLQDVYDLPALHRLMERVQQGEIQLCDVNTQTPSPFAAPLLFGYVAEFMYASDAPLAERQASMLALDSSLLGELLGQTDISELLDPAVVMQVEEELQHRAAGRQAVGMEGLVDLLRDLGPLSETEIMLRTEETPDACAGHLRALEKARRIIRVTIADEKRWAVVEDAARLRDALGTRLPPSLPAAFLTPLPDPLRDLLRRYARTHTLFTTAQAAAHFGLGVAVAGDALTALREQGTLLSGNFSQSATADGEWVASEVFRRLKLRSLQAAREATRPVAVQAWVMLLLERHGLVSDATAHTDAAHGAYEGINGVARVIEQLAGVALPASIWEAQIFPARVADYQPAMLDELLATGEAIWSGHKAAGKNDGLVALHLREFAAETLTPPDDDPDRLSPRHHAVLAALADGGAYFAWQIQAQLADTDPQEVQATLWDLAWQGYVTTDSWVALRGLTGPAGVTSRRPSRALRTRRGRLVSYTSMGARERQPVSTATVAGRWSRILREPVAPTIQALALAENMLDRYGIITRGAAVSEQIPGGFPALTPLLRGMEDAGRILRGHFVKGLGGAQFSDTATIDRLRMIDEARRQESVAVTLSALDPASPFGAITGWPPGAATSRPTRRSGALVVIWRGRLVLYLAQGGKELLTFDDQEMAHWQKAALTSLATALGRRKHGTFTLELVNGKPVATSPLDATLRAVGFSRVPKGYSWYG